jgi:hypothetical protein
MFWLGNKIFQGLKSLWAKFFGDADDAAPSWAGANREVVRPKAPG